MRRPGRSIAAGSLAALLWASAASAAPTHEQWQTWTSRANGVSDLMENYGDVGQLKDRVHTACNGTSAMFLTGGYPRWAAMVQPICAVLNAGLNGGIKHGCAVMPRFTREMAKGEPMPGEPEVEVARQRLIKAATETCQK